MAVAQASGYAAGARRRCAPLARGSSALLPQQPHLPLRGTASRRGAGEALCSPSRARDVARRQRVPLPRTGVLLRCLGCGFSRLAAGALRRARSAEPSLGHGLLVPALFRLGGDPPAPAHADLAEPKPAARLHALL